MISKQEWNTIFETWEQYNLTEEQTIEAQFMIEARARDTSHPFKAYSAAHSVACSFPQNVPD